MGAWDTLISIPLDTAFEAVADVIDKAMSDNSDQWNWYAVGGYGWEPWAYIDADGIWRDQGEKPIDEWRRQVATWRAEQPRLVTVRCKG